MATIKLFYDDRHIDKNGNGALKVKVSNCNTVSYIGLGDTYKFQPEQWDEKRSRVKSSVKNSRTLNENLEKMMLEYGLCLSKLGHTKLKAKELSNILLNKADTDHSVLKVFDEFVRLKDRDKTKESFLWTRGKIEEYAVNALSLQFDEINVEWLTMFHRWLRKSVSVNTTAIHLENLRAVVNYAIGEEYTTKYAFKKFKIEREYRVKPTMTLDDIKKIWYFKGWTAKEDFFIDLYKLIFSLCGINIADLYKLRVDNFINGRLEFIRTKTGVPVSIKVEPEALEIMQRMKGKNGMLLNLSERYANHLSLSSRFDKFLKTIGEWHWEGHYKIRDVVYWPWLSAYTARRSWATLVNSKLVGASLETVGMGLGHARTSMSAVYARPDLELLDEANRKMLDLIRQ